MDCGPTDTSAEAESTEDSVADESTGEGENSEAHLLQQMVRIRQKVAKDRVISVHDPEMRHGRKSAAKRFDGHKLSTSVDTESRLILSLDILAGNASDNQGALDLIFQAQENSGLLVELAVADCAYGDGATRKTFKSAGIDLRAKVPATPSGAPFHKHHFILDLTNRIATCPAGQTTTEVNHIRHRRGVTEQFLFPAEVCTECPHAGECLRAVDRRRGRGRSVVLHPQEDLIQEARLHQASPAFREDVRARQVVEHRLARLVQLGVRQARYRGKQKTRFQALMIANVANLTVMAAAIFSPSLTVLGPWRPLDGLPAAFLIYPAEVLLRAYVPAKAA